MSLYPIIWALEHAPVIDAAERAVLMALANKGDFDGCNAYRGYPALARVAKIDTKTVRRKCHAMEERGILRRQTGKMPEGWLKLPADKKTVVWEIMIPHSYYSAQQLANVNESRAERGRGPITPQNRPDLADAPAKPGRKDKGQERPERRKKKDGDPGERGDTKSPGTGGTTSPPATGHEVPSRGDSESPNPLMGPSDMTLSSSSAEVEDITHEAAPPAVAEKTKKTITPEAIVMQRTGCTEDEATAVVDYIEQQGDNGQPIRRIIPWVTGRTDRDLARDLAHVRRFADSPPVDAACSEHGVTLAPGYCSACEADMAAGDFETVRKILDRDGADARPDLARRLGAPHVPAQGTAGAPSIQDIQRAEKRARGGYTPYRNPANQDEYDGSLLPTPRPQDLTGALAPIVTAEQIRNGEVELRV
ncbi:hypothetical protein ABZ234_03480 [Nocardiopsis sp. NPDC006198]|uniref:hypothetical protein n=1 Tax=Nocardiopsis sp. NPDC006198 TaxID=3154472 RepID=UPI0033B13904